MMENDKVTLETEVHTVLSAVRDIDAGAKPHTFKSTTFVTPTNCAFCNKSIWGLAGSKGFICTGTIYNKHELTKECGYTCHAKCQMKAPQDCTGVNVKLEAKKSRKKKKGKEGEEEEEAAADGGSVFRNGSLKRTSTSSSVTPSVNTTNSTGNAAPSPIRISTISSMRPAGGHTRHISGAPPPEKFVTSPTSKAPPTSPFSSSNGGGTGNTQKAKVLYPYDATSAEELTVKQSDIITVLEPDDGSGWILGRVGREEGLIPASYVEIQTTLSEAPKKGPPVAPRRGGKKADEPRKKYVRALYDYDAGSELELTIREGDVLVVVGEDKGDGWTEVEMKGQVGSVPSNYVEVTERP